MLILLVRSRQWQHSHGQKRVGAEPSLRAKAEAKLPDQIVEVFQANKERYETLAIGP